MANNIGEIGREKILSTNISNIGKSFIEEMFAAYHERETNTYHQAPFDPTTPIKLTNGMYKYVKGEIMTDLGTLLFNRYLLEKYDLIQQR